MAIYVGANKISPFSGVNKIGIAYFGTNIVFGLGNPAPSFDPDAQAFFNAVEGAGGTLTLTEKSAVNTLVEDLKADSMWTSMKALYPLVGGTQSSVKFNLKDPQDTDAAFRLTFNGTVTIDSNGISGNNASSTWVDTKLVPSTVITSATSWQMGVYSRTSNTDNGCEIGSDGSNGFMNALYLYFNTNYLINFRQEFKTSSSTSTQGLFVSGPDGSNVRLYRNGSSIINTAQTGVRSNLKLALLGNFNGTNASDPSTRQVALAFVYDGILPSQSDFYTNVQNFQTTLGRQV